MLPVPPEDLRLWVGPFADPDTFLRSGRETVALMRSLCGLQPDHSVLDVGCGSGRVALGLIGHLASPGRYIGFDPALKPIEWCQAHIASRHAEFEFVHVDVHNASYHPEGQRSADAVRFPAASASIDVALLSSVFTHLLPDDVAAYTRELYRVVRPGGRCLISYLLMNAAAEAAVSARTTIFDLRYRCGPFVTFSRDDPTEGLAYDEQFALAMLQEAGLEVETIRYGTWRDVHSYEVQHDWVVARKPSSAA